MSKIKGQNFRAFIGGMAAANAVPEATNVSITMTGNTEDSSTKDSEGLYAQESVVSSSYSLQVDTFQSEKTQILQIIAMFNAAKPVSVGWDETSSAAGGKNRTPTEANFSRQGKALLNDVTFSFNDRETVSTSMQFQGTGALN